MFVGQKEWPVANTKTKKEKTKKSLKWVIFERKCVTIPDSLDPTCQKLGSYAKNYGHMPKTLTCK